MLLTPLIMVTESCQKRKSSGTFCANFPMYASYGSKKLLKKFGNFLIRQKCRDLGKKFANFLRWKSAKESFAARIEPIHAQHPLHEDSQTTAAYVGNEVDKFGECDLSFSRIALTKGFQQPLDEGLASLPVHR